jgi:hypothetical protein
MAEDSAQSSVKAKNYEQDTPLTYTYAPKLSADSFQYIYNEGALSCSVRPSKYADLCFVSANELNSAAKDSPSFVYLDCGAWLDNADGKGKQCRDFGLVCGPHVYLCKFVKAGPAAQSDVKSVGKFLRALADGGCGSQIVKYAYAKGVSAESLTDPSLYLFIPDLHMPPVTWFCKRETLTWMGTELNAATPAWLAGTEAFKASDGLYRNYFRWAQYGRDHNKPPVSILPGDTPDIFGNAGRDLAYLLTGLSKLPAAIQELLHVIHIGDMFELWLGHDWLQDDGYQYRAGTVDPEWKGDKSIDIVSGWAVQVMIENTPVFEGFARLHESAVKEVKYLWGNHDAYVKDPRVVAKLGVPQRDPWYTGMNGDLFCEHGHRFDDSNFDNVGRSDGPLGADVAYHQPTFRKYESLARGAPKPGRYGEPDCYLVGASLLYLHQKYRLEQKPFSIYVMGHTHACKLFHFPIKARLNPEPVSTDQADAQLQNRLQGD